MGGAFTFYFFRFGSGCQRRLQRPWKQMSFRLSVSDKSRTSRLCGRAIGGNQTLGQRLCGTSTAATLVDGRSSMGRRAARPRARRCVTQAFADV